jgi:acyl carrier protein
VRLEQAWRKYDVNSDRYADTVKSNPPPRETERVVASLWSEVLQTTQLPDPNDNFFSLGGNSMTMVMLEYRIQEEFSIELPTGALLGAPTLRELSELLDAERAASRDSGSSPAEQSITP